MGDSRHLCGRYCILMVDGCRLGDLAANRENSRVRMTLVISLWRVMNLSIRESPRQGDPEGCHFSSLFACLGRRSRRQSQSAQARREGRG